MSDVSEQSAPTDEQRAEVADSRGKGPPAISAANMSSVPEVKAAPPTATPGAPARPAAESASNTGIFTRTPSGAQLPATQARPGSSGALRATGASTSARLAKIVPEAPPKRRDPRAPSVFVQKVEPRSAQLARVWLRRVTYTALVIGVLTVIGVSVNSALERQREERAVLEKSIDRNFDMAEVLERMSKLESECASQRALIRLQDFELKRLKNELSACTQSSSSVLQRLNTPKAAEAAKAPEPAR